MEEQKTVYPPAVAELIDQFRNEAICRHESNQHKAKVIWKKLGPLLTERERNEIRTDWYHYANNSLETEPFGEELKKLAAKYRTI